ncbi:MAG: pyridoxamine 5'-phosphate oxidase, partial [Acidimicrobiales bacterium]
GAATAGAGPQIAFVVRGNARKLGYIRRSGRATVVFRSGWEWVSAEGPARIVAEEYPDLPGLLRAVFAAAGGTHDDWDTFDRVMADEHRVAVLVEPARIISNG